MNIVWYMNSLPQLRHTALTSCMGTSPECLRLRSLAPPWACGAGHAVVRWREGWDESPGETTADAAFEGRRHKLYGPEASSTPTLGQRMPQVDKMRINGFGSVWLIVNRFGGSPDPVRTVAYPLGLC
jgi:hypothetical protein